MEKVVALAREKPGAADWILQQQAFVLAYSGHLRQAATMHQRAVDMAVKAGQRDRAAQYEAGAAVLEALFKNAPEAKRRSAAALALSKSRDVEYGAALALALTGDSSRSEALTDDLQKRLPEDTLVKFNYLPTLRALLALNHGASSSVIDLLQTAAPYELGSTYSSMLGLFGNLYPIYVRGEAYLTVNKGVEAAAEFQKILDHRGLIMNDPIGALARLKMGRALVLSGDKAKAKAAYHDFLNLWKEADPDIPILKEAQREYAKLS
jgi:hypothetical protein